MKNAVMSILAASVCATGVFASPVASAVDAPRDEVFQAAGMCAPAYDNAYRGIRFRASGVRNQGTATVSFACTAPGDWREAASSDGAQHLSMRVANFAATSITIKCTLRPGYSAGAGTELTQGAFPQSHVLAPGEVYWFNWMAADLLPAGTEFANPNFGCDVPPGGELQYMWRQYQENIGT